MSCLDAHFETAGSAPRALVCRSAGLLVAVGATEALPASAIEVDKVCALKHRPHTTVCGVRCSVRHCGGRRDRAAAPEIEARGAGESAGEDGDGFFTTEAL